jgi:hypothetical protein
LFQRAAALAAARLIFNRPGNDRKYPGYQTGSRAITLGLLWRCETAFRGGHCLLKVPAVTTVFQVRTSITTRRNSLHKIIHRIIFITYYILDSYIYNDGSNHFSGRVSVEEPTCERHSRKRFRKKWRAEREPHIVWQQRIRTFFTTLQKN